MKKRFLSIALALALVLLFASCGSEKEAELIRPGVMGLNETPLESLDDILNASTFIVKAKAVSSGQFNVMGTYEYTFSVLQDFAGNLICDDDGIFHVYDSYSEAYEAEEVYYLFLTGSQPSFWSYPKYQSVSPSVLVQEDSGLFSARIYSSVDIGLSSARSLKSEITAFVSDNRDTLILEGQESLTPEKPESLEDAFSSADAIWRIRVGQVDPVNKFVDIFTYGVKQVLYGDERYAHQSFSQTMASGRAVPGEEYYLILSLSGLSDKDLRIPSEDCLIPTDSPEAQKLLAMLSRTETAQTPGAEQ